jgi:hypothetical protein
MISSPTRRRVDSEARWRQAVARALEHDIRVAQLQGSGQWIATSGSQPGVAYELEVTGNVAHGCTCLAGLNSDPVCQHRAAFSLRLGALEPSPEPDPPAPVLAQDCPDCHGCGVRYDRTLERAGWLYPPCAACEGTGMISAPHVSALAA